MSAKDSEVGPGALRGVGWVPVLGGGIGRPQPCAAANLLPSRPSRPSSGQGSLPPTRPTGFVNRVLNLGQEEEEVEEGQAGWEWPRRHAGRWEQDAGLGCCCSAGKRTVLGNIILGLDEGIL